MDIDFIRESIRNIQKESKKEKLTIFVGAGVSRNSGIPGWNSLITKLADKMGRKLEINSFDEYVKIAEMFYNERGNKEYFETVKNIINIKMEPNDIHKIIFGLNPQSIITTNYDDLLENSMYQNSDLSYSIIKTDKDLSQIKNNRLIIKMHGDFDNNNFVLKESDYMNYSQDFPLIENYIKSLLSTNLFLFVGYGVNDYNFKLIQNYVKNNMKEFYQPAYLINTGNNVPYQEFQYYKSRGIQILDYNLISEEVEKQKYNTTLKDQGKNLFSFLMYIKKHHEPFIDYLFNILQETKDVPYLSIQKIHYFINEFFKNKNLEKCSSQFISSEKTIKITINKNNSAFFEEIIEIISNNKFHLDKCKDKIQYIESRLKQYDIKKIIVNIDNNENTLFETNGSIKYNFLCKRSQTDNIYNSNYKIQLEEAFFNWRIGDWVNADNLLNSSRLKARRERNLYYNYIITYNKFLISGFNSIIEVMRDAKKPIKNKKTEEESKKILENKIELIKENMTLLQKNALEIKGFEHMLKISSQLNSLKIDIQNEIEKKKYSYCKNTSRINIYKKEDKFEKLNSIVDEFLNMYFNHFIFIDIYKEVKNISIDYLKVLLLLNEFELDEKGIFFLYEFSDHNYLYNQITKYQEESKKRVLVQKFELNASNKKNIINTLIEEFNFINQKLIYHKQTIPQRLYKLILLFLLIKIKEDEFKDIFEAILNAKYLEKLLFPTSLEYIKLFIRGNRNNFIKLHKNNQKVIISFIDTLNSKKEKIKDEWKIDKLINEIEIIQNTGGN